MALTNFTLPFGGLAGPSWGATISPIQTHHATAVNSLLYGPAGHQESDSAPPSGVSHQDYYKNSPYAPPQNHQYRSKPNNNYLPPPPAQQPQQQYNQQQQVHQQQQQQQQHQNRGQDYTQRSQVNQRYNQHSTYTAQNTRTYGEGSYSQVPGQIGTIQHSSQYYNTYNTQSRTYNSQPREPQGPDVQSQDTGLSSQDGGAGQTNLGEDVGRGQDEDGSDAATGKLEQLNNQGYPQLPPGYARVEPVQPPRTSIHPIIDYDGDDDEETNYYGGHNQGGHVLDGQRPIVTPIQGPIFVKNGTVPVVPLFSYPTINNGTFVQIPIWWTALSVALGLEIHGDIIRGVPCIKRYHQLFCPTAGNTYPIDKIERFIDDNKALMRRMYGDFEMNEPFGSGGLNKKRKRRRTDEPDDIDLFGAPDTLSHPMDKFEIEPDTETGETYFGKWRKKRQSSPRNPINNPPPRRNQKQTRGPEAPGNANQSDTGRIDACESKIEIVTPYWASNSAGKIRAIVNTQHFEQAIHQEICTKKQTGRCGNDCGCEQKYKWHRLLAYDPDNDCKGIFMDWFLFPSCCVCRCNPS